MSRFSFVVFALMLTLGGIARAQDLRLGTMSWTGRGLLSVFLVPNDDERCAVEIRDSTGSRVQEIESETLDCKEHWWPRAFVTMDLNFDGFADFGFTSHCGNRNCGCIWFLYSPVRRQFEASPALADQSCDFQLDRKAKTLTSRLRSVNSWYVDTYQWKNAKLILVRRELNLMAGPEPEARVCAVTQIVSKPRKAEMVEVSRTCKLNGEPCSCEDAKMFF